MLADLTIGTSRPKRRLSYSEMEALDTLCARLTGSAGTAMGKPRNDLKLSKGAFVRRWDGVVGQHRAVRTLRKAVADAAARGVPMGHVLVKSGTPGVGKTLLASLVVKDLIKKGVARQCVSLSGKGLTGEGLAKVVAERGLADGDVVFLDEAHRLSDPEALLTVLFESYVSTPTGPVALPRLTFILATTHPGLLPEALVNRIPVQPVIVPLTAAEAALVARQALAREWPGAVVGDATVAGIAAASRNAPRVMSALVCSLRAEAAAGFAVADAAGEWDLTDVLDEAGLTREGYDRVAVKVLTVLADLRRDAAAAGRGKDAMGITRLTRTVREPSGIDTAERVLVEDGLVEYTGAGLRATDKGMAWLANQ